MDKIQHRIKINAPKERVYKIMLEDATYREWTAPFHEGSHFVGTWEKGSKILFLGPDGTGMVARIAENRPNEFVSIEHLGLVMGDVEDTTSDMVKQWAGAHENYTFNDLDGATELVIDLDTNDDMKEMLEVTYPKALQIVKKIAEGTKQV